MGTSESESTISSRVGRYVKRVVDGSILREFTGQARKRGFLYHSYVRLFQDSEPEAGT